MLGGIIGHTSEVRFFEEGLKSKTLSHAYCFDGIEGIGKRTLALELAKNALCGSDERLIRHFEAGSHGDLHLVKPVDGQIKSESILEIIDFLSTSPSVSDYKFVLIDRADKMNLVAQNKALKIIEEPPNYVVFILICSNYDAMIDTLKSRLIRISFNPLSGEEVSAYCLKNGFEIDRDLIIESGGSISRYLELLNMEDESPDKIAKKLINALISGDCGLIYEILDILSSRKDDFELILTAIERMFLQNINRDVQTNLRVLDIVSDIRNRLDRNQQLDLLIVVFVNRLQEVFK